MEKITKIALEWYLFSKVCEGIFEFDPSWKLYSLYNNFNGPGSGQAILPTYGDL